MHPPIGKGYSMAGEIGLTEMREMAGQLDFETLLAELSARFISLPAEAVDGEIVAAQRLVCERLGLDLSALWQWEGEEQINLLLTHYHREGNEPPVPERMDAETFFPWSRRQLLDGQLVVVSSAEELPAEAAIDQANWRHFGVKTTLTIPLAAGGTAIGTVSFNDMRAERAWSEALIRRLKLVAQVFANALVRKRSEEALRESEARLELAADSAGAGLWSLNLASESFWLTDKTRELIQLVPGEPLVLGQFLERVHPDDRAAVRLILEKVTGSRDEARVEYRIVHADGSVRWLASRGRLQCGVPGEADCVVMGITVDVTERKEREEHLRSSEARLASAVEMAGLGFYEVVDGERFSFMDNRGRDLIGAPAGQDQRLPMVQFWADRIHPEDRPFVMELYRKMHAGELDLVSPEYRYLHPQRGTIWLHHLSHILARDGAGRAIHIIGVLRDITAQKRSEEELRNALAEVQVLRDRLQQENVYLREQLRRDDGQDAIVGESEAILQMIAKARKVAPTGATVLITGETGTGKELLAQMIHDLGSRKGKAMVKVNCAALPAPLIEGELFGREKGAYTGAMTQQCGRFEIADGSTIFLDEIGDLPLELQTKLLRVLQDGCFERLGSHRTLRTDCRVVAATNRDLAKMVREGRFREDLFHRLNVFPIHAPPLRERVEDIPLLVWKFVQEFNTKMGRSIDSIPRQTMERIKCYPWPGNVRELRNLVERAMILSEGRSLKMELPDTDRDAPVRLDTLEAVERNHIRTVLERTHWRISGKDGAASILGMVPTTLHSRMKKLGITRPTT